MTHFIEDTGWTPCDYGSRRTLVVRGDGRGDMFIAVDCFAVLRDPTTVKGFGYESMVKCLASSQNTSICARNACAELVVSSELGARRRCINAAIGFVARQGVLSIHSLRRCLRAGGGRIQ